MLPATRDDCRRVLRRLELEAYSYTVSALRAQGPLRTEARQTLAALRQTLHIGAARHQAEARRVCNDELLAAIAEQLTGPNTELEWVQEGRRKIPIMPRGVPQTIYTAIADRAALEALEENENIARKNKAKRSAQLVSSEILEDGSDEEMKDAEAVDDVNGNLKPKTETDYPPIVTSDQSLKIKSDEGPPRKKSRPEVLVISHRVPQKHPNLSQIYSSYSKSHSGKLSTSYGRNPYSQSGKAAAKSNHSGLSKSSLSKHRSLQKHSSSAKHCGQVAIPHHRVRSGIKSPTDPHIAGSQALVQNQIDVNSVKSQTPVYQANYAPTAQGGVEEYDTDAKLPVGSTVLSDSPTMQSLTQSSISRDDASMQMSSEDAQNVPSSVHYSIANSNMSITVPAATKLQAAGKPCHLIIKKKSDSNSADAQKFQVTNKQLSKQDLSNLKVLQNRQVMIQPSNNSAQQKMLNSSAKLITTKIVAQMNSNNNAQQQVLIMPKSPNSPTMQRNLANAALKNFFISTSGMASIAGDADGATVKNVDSESLSKNVILNNSDMKLSTKTFLLNSKSGQKMVVLPAKRPKALAGQTVPLLQVKGVKPAAVKLVTVSSPAINNQPKPTNITVLSKSISSNVMGSPAKVVSKESFNQNKLNAINAPNVQIPPKKHPSSKGNIIVVQKSNTLHKNQLPLSKAATECNTLTDKMLSVPLDTVVPNSILTNIPQLESSIDKPLENVVFLEVNADQIQQVDSFDTFMDKTENADVKESTEMIAGDAQILFHADSMESTADSLIEESQIQESAKSESSFCELQQMEDEEAKGLASRTTTLSTFTNWEEELANSNVKENDDSKTSEMNLVLEMSSDSEFGIHTEEVCKEKDLSQDESQYDEQEISKNIYVQHSSISQTKKLLLSQLQDDDSSSNDSPFVLTNNLGFRNERKSDDANITFLSNNTIDEIATSSEQKQECRSKPSRADIVFSSAVAAGDISLGTFEYLEDNANSREDMFQFNTGEGKTKEYTADIGT